MNGVLTQMELLLCIGGVSTTSWDAVELLTVGTGAAVELSAVAAVLLSVPSAALLLLLRVSIPLAEPLLLPESGGNPTGSPVSDCPVLLLTGAGAVEELATSPAVLDMGASDAVELTAEMEPVLDAPTVVLSVPALVVKLVILTTRGTAGTVMSIRANPCGQYCCKFNARRGSLAL